MEEKKEEKVKLFCMIYGTKRIFSIEVEHDLDISSVKDAIKDKLKDTINGVADQLTLYHVNLSILKIS